MVDFYRSISFTILTILLIVTSSFKAIAEEVSTKDKEFVKDLIANAKAVRASDDSTAQVIRMLYRAYSYADSVNYARGVILASYHLGTTYLTKSDNAQATLYYYTSMKRAEKELDSSSMHKAYMGLGLVNYNLNKWDDAVEQFNRARELDVKEKHSKAQDALMNYLLGLCYHNLKEYDKSEDYLLDAKRAAEKQGDSVRLAEIRLYQNHIALEQGRTENVVEEYNQLLAFFKERKERVGMCYVKNGLARYYLKKGDYELALKNSKEALVLAESVDVLYPMQQVLEVLVDAQYANKNYKQSADYLKQLNQLKDSVNSQSVSSKIAMLNADYQFQKKENQLNAELKAENRQKRWLLISLAGSLLTVIIIFITLRTVAKERKRSDKLLLNILPKETAMELKLNGVAKAKRHEDVTVVFADALSFTTIASRLSAAEVVRMLDRYFSSFDAIIQEFKLEKIKTIGDSYMFVSGLEFTDNSALPAAKAAIKMLATIDKLKEEMERDYGASFDFRVGMHTGNVVSGVVGHVKYAFDIWGDSVNVAARLESKSEPGKVNVSESTYYLLKDHFKLTPRGEVDIKNRGHIKMYFLEYT
jgi:adenylate cyclase